MAGQSGYPSSTATQTGLGRMSASLGVGADPVNRGLAGVTGAAAYKRIRVTFPLFDTVELLPGDVLRGHMEFGQNVTMQSPRVRWKWWPTTAAAGSIVWEVRVWYVRQGVAVSSLPD